MNSSTGYNLFSQYKRIEDWDYYGKDTPQEIQKKKLVDLFDGFSSSKAREFIFSYFDKGRKLERAFNIDEDFEKKFRDNGTHQHTVSLFFLGCLLKSLINEELECFLCKHINGMVKTNNTDKEDVFSYDFLYTWFLTCLYHDTASCIEKSKWTEDCSSDLGFYLGKYDIKYNVYDHVWDNPCYIPYTYSINLIKNYFKYKVKERREIDHGIIAGFWLYDRLIKNYNDTWEKYPELNNGSYDHCTIDNIHWRKEHHSHFAIIADAIIAHNIWHSDNTNEYLYKQYGLDPIISCENNKLSAKKNPLAFFLGLVDTIEPVKHIISHCKFHYCPHVINRCKDPHCLDSISIKVEDKNIDIWIEFEDSNFHPNIFASWMSNICNENTWGWLDLELPPDNTNNKVRICILQE